MALLRNLALLRTLEAVAFIIRAIEHVRHLRLNFVRKQSRVNPNSTLLPFNLPRVRKAYVPRLKFAIICFSRANFKAESRSSNNEAYFRNYVILMAWYMENFITTGGKVAKKLVLQMHRSIACANMSRNDCFTFLLGTLSRIMQGKYCYSYVSTNQLP